MLFCIPALVYVAVQSRGRDATFGSAMDRIGAASWGSASAYGWAALLLAPLLLASWLSIALIPAEALDTPGVSIARLTSVGAAVAVILRAAGEEVFFRGLLGGILVRRLGFAAGNLVQAALFLVPHLLLLAIDVRLWPIIPAQFVAGWLLGWLRHRTGTLVPGAAVHAVVNVAAGLLTS